MSTRDDEFFCDPSGRDPWESLDGELEEIDIDEDEVID